MNLIAKYLVVVVLAMSTSTLYAGTEQVNNLSIQMIRTVGDYGGTTYDNSVELWFSPPIAWTTSMACTENFRVYIDAKHSHMISAAYTAFVSGKMVNIHADDSLPIRGGSCEISYLDIIK